MAHIMSNYVLLSTVTCKIIGYTNGYCEGNKFVLQMNVWKWFIYKQIFGLSKKENGLG